MAAATHTQSSASPPLINRDLFISLFYQQLLLRFYGIGRRCGMLNGPVYGKASSSAATAALSPKVWLMCANRSTFPGPSTKLPPS